MSTLTSNVWGTIRRINAQVPKSVTPETRVSLHPADWIELTEEIERLQKEVADCRELIANAIGGTEPWQDCQTLACKPNRRCMNSDDCNTRVAHETRADPACIDCIELKNALAAAVGVANEARECHDRDQDMRVMKLLMALAGHVPKYRADTDHIHDVLRRAVERLTSPAHAQECDFAQGECTCGADLAAGERNRAALKASEHHSLSSSAATARTIDRYFDGKPGASESEGEDRG